MTGVVTCHMLPQLSGDPHFHRVVITSRGPGIFPGYKESGPRLLLLENRRKIEPKEIPSRLIPHLLAVFTRQLEILVTTPFHVKTIYSPNQRIESSTSNAYFISPSTSPGVSTNVTKLNFFCFDVEISVVK